jgi:hypothetical protein
VINDLIEVFLSNNNINVNNIDNTLDSINS